MTMQIHWSIDNRGDVPNTQGLSESIDVGILNVNRNFKMFYEWGLNTPKEGLHKYFKDYDYRKNYWANIFSWCDIWVPDPNYSGYINLDIESFPLFKDELPNWGAMYDRWVEFQGETNQIFNWELAARQFYSDTLHLVKICRPKSKVAYWSTPSFSLYDVNKSERELSRIRSKHNRAEWFYRLQDYICPAWYIPAPIGTLDNWHITQESFNKWIDLNCQEQLRLKSRFAPSKKFIPCVSTSYAVTAGPYYERGQRVKPEEFQILLEKIVGHGYHEIVLWDTIESIESKNAIQNILTQYEISIRRAPIDPPIVIG